MDSILHVFYVKNKTITSEKFLTDGPQIRSDTIYASHNLVLSISILASFGRFAIVLPVSYFT